MKRFLMLVLALFSGCGGNSDGDSAGRPCEAGSAECGDAGFCKLPEGSCGDASGTCSERPQICTEVYAPVCGCDGATYASDCMAAAAGASIASQGPCSPSGISSASQLDCARSSAAGRSS